MERGFGRRIVGSSARSRWSLAFALAAGLALSLSVPAQAATDVVDQSQTNTFGFENTTQMAQTFTAGMTGRMDLVSLSSDAGFASGVVQIQSVTGAFPAGTVLGSTSFSASYLCCRGFHDFAFTPAISITAGAHYAIVVRISSGQLTWRNSGGVDAYANGQLYIGCRGCAWGTDTLHGGDFAFKTWAVGGSANQAPVVAADSSSVTVNEGTAPATTGTFSDPDGDTVALTASAGTVTQTGTSAGTWSWTGPASDETASQTITVTADDGNGLTANTTFSSTVAGVAPTVAITSTPASSPEGTTVTLNGSASSPSAEDNAAGFTYSWTATKNGTSFGSGSAAAFSFTPDDEGTFVATLQVKDDGGMPGTASVTVTGANVAPSAKITSISWTPQLFLTVNQSVSVAGTFTDPGKLDTHTTTWKFGDGATSTGSSAVHSYSTAGTYTIAITVVDDDGGMGQATTTVTVQSAAQALTSTAGYVQNIKSLNAGQRNSLIAKLNAAGASTARGDTTAANNQLNAFLNELQADLSTGRISTGDAATLRAAVHSVQAALGTYNRFLEWWPLG